MQPEIIFEELDHYYFDIVYAEGYNPKSLEAIAIKQYLKTYPIEHIAVDTHEIKEEDIFNGFDKISNKCAEYTELVHHHFSMVKNYGYSFLNNNDIIAMFDKMHNLEENVLLELNDSNLSNHYKTYNELHEKRDNEMLQNINNYCNQHQFNKGLFICGAEHRKSLIQKIAGYQKEEKSKLNWTFYND